MTKALLLSFVSGALLVFAFEPFSFPVLAFAGLVPFFFILSTPLPTRTLLLSGFAFALPFFVGTTYWMFFLARFTPAGVPGAVGSLVMHTGAFFVFPISMNIVLHNLRIPFAVAAPTLWVVSEHTHAYGDFYFPWTTLAHSLSGWPLLIQHADIVGVYGISWWIVCINALITTLIRSRSDGRSLRLPALALTAVVAVPLVYDALRWRSVERSLAGARSIDVAVVQPNVPQDLKWNLASAPEIFENLSRLVEQAEATSPDLVVGPEASLPVIISTSSHRLPTVIPEGRSPMLIGIVAGIGEGKVRTVGRHTFTMYDRHYNSAFLVSPDRSVLDRHDKQFLVAVTEQIPYRAVLGFLLPFMNKQFGRFDPADNLHLLEVPGRAGGVRVGVLICYESLFPSLVRKMRRMGAEVLVNITNDAWFGRSSFPYQHAGINVLRAIENRCSIVRSANTGISAFYDPLGRMSGASDIFEPAVLSGRVLLTNGVTVYGVIGDAVLWLSYGGWTLLLGAAWISFRRTQRGAQSIQRGSLESKTLSS